MSVYCIVNQTVRLSDPTGIVNLRDPLAYTNQRAHAFRVTVLAEGSDQPADLTGVGVTGSFMKLKVDETVTPISGTVDTANGICEVVLPASCYVTPGRFKFTMDISFGSSPTAENRTILWVEGYVERNQSGTIIDPGTPVGNITQAINNANNAASDANTAATAALNAAAAANDAVSYLEQTGKTDAEKAQARTNIAAAGAAELETAVSDAAVYTDTEVSRAISEAADYTDAETARATAEEARIEALFTGDVGEAVDDWLTEHPEAFENAIPLPAKNFLRVGCIGDSFTEGYIALSTATAQGVSTCSWPYFLSKLTGHEWTNFGVHASGVKTWVEGTGGFTKLSEVQAPGNVCQAYVIGLMLNDCKPGLTAYVPVGTVDDMGTEADSYYAYYDRLIGLVHAVNPAAPIFVLTCPGTDKDSKLIPYNTALREIAAYCKTTEGLPVYLCDLDSQDYNNSRYFKHRIFNLDYVGGHYTGLGYEMIAECLLRVISDVMVANYTEFRTIQQIPYDDNTEITDHEIRIGQLEASVTPEWLTSVVRTGKASEYFSIGDEINIPWTNYAPSTPVLYNMPFIVVHFGDVYDQYDILHHNAMWLQSKYAFPQTMRFDQPEIVQETESTFQSGFYYYVKSGSDYIQQTVTPGATIPSGVTYYRHSKANAGSAIRYGANNWNESGYRQWLNSDAGKNAWWTAQHSTDLAPFQLATVPGFMCGFTEAWRKIFKPVKVYTAKNSVYAGGGNSVTYDKFFLASVEQMYGVPEAEGVEGAYWEYWKTATGLEEPSNGDNSHQNNARKIPAINNTSSPQTNRLRSATLNDGGSVYLVGSAGYIATSDASSSLAPLACCVLF